MNMNPPAIPALAGAARARAMGLGLRPSASPEGQGITVSTSVAHGVCGNGKVSDNGNAPCDQPPAGNTLAITSTGVVKGWAYGGGNNLDRTAVIHNRTTVNGQVTGNAMGSNHDIDVGSAVASHSAISVSGGAAAVGASVWGAYAYAANGAAMAANNTASVDGGAAVSGDIYGGQAVANNGDTTASHNQVIIDGGKIAGTTIIGGEAVSDSGAAAAENNTVTIQGNAVLSGDARLYGGYARGTTIAVSSNNTLNLHAAGLSVRGLEAFQNLNFRLPANLACGGAMLKITGEADLGANAAVAVELEGAGPARLNVGDTFDLIRGGVTGSINALSGRGVLGRYHYTLAVTDGNLRLTIGAAIVGGGRGGFALPRGVEASR